jgi:hypothetical protein
VRISEVRKAGPFVNGHPKGIDLPAKCRMRTHIVDDFVHTLEQS